MAVPSLLEVISGLTDIASGDGVSDDLRPTPWTPQTDALVLRGAELPGGMTTDSGHRYLLEVSIAIEVIDVWRAWRDGAMPSPEEATLAIIHYAETDAYQPVVDDDF
jgi:hypothetical protein